MVKAMMNRCHIGRVGTSCVAVALLFVVSYAVATVDDEVVRRGAAIENSPVVSIEDVMGDPDKYLDKKVILEGTVYEVCQKKGCWMEVVCGEKEIGVRMTFKDYGFFVPMDCHGMLVRAEGKFTRKTWSKEDADHLAGEGASLVRNPDGTATELGFIASGVELRPAPEAPDVDEETDDTPPGEDAGS